MPNSDDDSDFAEYGTALEAIEEDDVTKKRPIRVEEQIAVDERGRRRFHGAFTGGFSAGYFNTVGSKEGWTPSTFKSSRGERGSFKNQNVLDFMDDEDKGAFGIAPQVLRPTDDFADKNESRAKKRPMTKEAHGPIPGLPVLEQIIQPVKETVGIKILIKMGWRPGKGIGPKIQRQSKPKKSRIERAEKVIDDEDEDMEKGNEEGTTSHQKMYGCFLPPDLGMSKRDSESDGSDDIPEEAEELLAPDDVNSLLCNPKENSFGLGYKGLDRNTLTSTSSHVDLFGGTKLKFRVENKHFDITGQAFGVGAFEDNDEDIYSREDMSQYDFALETPEEKRKRKAKEDLDKRKKKNKENCIEGFKLSSATKLTRKSFPPPHLPRNFVPIHCTKKSRFESSMPTPEISEKQETAAKGLGRHNLTISERQVLIEDDINKVMSESKVAKNVDEPPNELTKSQKGDSSVPAEAKSKQSDSDSDIQHRIERLKKFTQVLQAYTSNKPDDSQKASFKPFMKNPEKQERYEKYLTLLEAGFSESLRDLQPPDMADCEREREKMEFERASKLYKPMNSILSSRFTSAKSHDISHLEPEKEIVKQKDPKDDPKVAAKMQLFGKLTHKVVEWHPDKLVCKRFNVPHPYPDSKFVGVKGDPSFGGNKSSSVPASSSLSTSSVPNQAQTSVPPPKKSLFDNLDFSKPPPGLLPPGVPQPSSSTNSPMESSVEAEGRSVLAFQQELSSTHGTNENTEILPSEVARPPLDLFKEIFADSSDESEDEVTEISSTSLQTNLEKEKHSQQSKSEHMPRDKSVATIHDGKISDKVGPSHYREKSPPSDNKTANKKVIASTVPYQRRVFDKIDLDKLQDHAHEKSDEKSSNTIPRISNNNDDDDEEEDDTYGPLPPKNTSSSNNNSSRQDLEKPMFIPRGSSNKTPPVSSSVMNYNLPNKSHDDGTKEKNEEEVVWVEKSALSDRKSRSHVKKSKKHSSSSSAKKSRRKSSKKEKHKSHKSNKRHKHKKKAAHKHKSKEKHYHRESSSSSSDSSGSDEDDSSASSDSSVTINDSLDNRALLAKLKKITNI